MSGSFYFNNLAGHVNDLDHGLCQDPRMPHLSKAKNTLSDLDIYTSSIRFNKLTVVYVKKVIDIIELLNLNAYLELVQSEALRPQGRSNWAWLHLRQSLRLPCSIGLRIIALPALKIMNNW